MAISPDGNYAYVTLLGENNLAVVDLRSGTVTAKFPISANAIAVAIQSLPAEYCL